MNNTNIVDTKKLIISCGISFFVVLFLIILSTVIPNIVIAQNGENQSSGVLFRDFTKIQDESLLINSESVSYMSGVAPWKISTDGNFTNAAELQAKAAAAAKANEVVLSRNSVRSFVQAGTAVPAGTPEGVPRSAAPPAPGNGYAAGYCTWYAYNRRYQLGNPVPNMLGNGGSWAANARARGMSVDHNPRPGDVIDMPGHVAIVEVVGDNNTVFISEMNYGGLYRYNLRWVSNATSYWYIH